MADDELSFENPGKLIEEWHAVCRDLDNLEERVRALVNRAIQRRLRLGEDNQPFLGEHDMHHVRMYREAMQRNLTIINQIVPEHCEPTGATSVIPFPQVMSPREAAA